MCDLSKEQKNESVCESKWKYLKRKIMKEPTEDLFIKKAKEHGKKKKF